MWVIYCKFPFASLIKLWMSLPSHCSFDFLASGHSTFSHTEPICAHIPLQTFEDLSLQMPTFQAVTSNRSHWIQARNLISIDLFLSPLHWECSSAPKSISCILQALREYHFEEAHLVPKPYLHLAKPMYHIWPEDLWYNARVRWVSLPESRFTIPSVWSRSEALQLHFNSQEVKPLFQSKLSKAFHFYF